MEAKSLHGIKRVPQCNYLHRVDSIISGRSPPLYCSITLISIQGHQNHIFKNLRVPDYSVVIWSYMVLQKLKLNLINISIQVSLFVTIDLI